MTLHTQQSLSGFITSEPQQSVTGNGETRFYVRVGQPHFLREGSGSFTVLEPTFHDLARTNYDADRTRRSAAGAEQDAPAAQKVTSQWAGLARTGSAVLGL